MEVHHHPHVEKKSFKEYILEGLMIFIAVSMGFIAESIREYITDREREKQYIEAFIRDLKADTASINRTIKLNIKKEHAIDSLMIVADSDLTLPQNSKKFIEYFVKATGLPRHLPNTSAMSQLKSTGSLRLLSHKREVADSILKYDSFNELIIQHNEAYFNSTDGVWQALYPVINIKIFRDSSYINFSQRTVTEKQTPPLHFSKEGLNTLLGFETRHALTNQVNRNYLQTQLQRALRLIRFLEAEYNIHE